MTEVECTAAGKTWMANAINPADNATMCATGTPSNIMGCFVRGRYGSSCDCSAKYGNDYATLCTGQWKDCTDYSGGKDCNVLPSAELVAARAAPAPPSPPLTPPLPPSLPPAPPQKCIPQVRFRRSPLPSRPHALTQSIADPTPPHLPPAAVPIQELWGRTSRHANRAGGTRQ